MKRPLMISSILCLAIAAASAQDWQTVVKKFGPAVGKAETREGATVLASGSCFLIDENGTLLTNAHVVRDASFSSRRRVVVTFPFSSDATKEYEAKITKIGTEELDIALLSISGKFPSFCTLSKEAEPPLMSEVLVAGYPLGKSFKSTPGFLQAYQEIEGIGHMMDLSASVDAGNSGGPVFDKEGRVIGIVTAKIPGYNFNLALPVRIASDFIAAQDALTTISLATNPAGARVFLNGIYRGASPLDLELYHRDYALILEKDGYTTVETTISPDKDGKVIAINLNPAVDPNALTLTITTTPPGAKIVIDNTEQGTSPAVITTTKGARLRIRLTLKGYKDLYEEVMLGSDAQQTLSYTLQKAGLFW